MRRELLMISYQERTLERIKISDLVPAARNARTHSKHQIKQLAKSIQHFSFTNPILIDSARRIIAGHGRIAAAKVLGMTEVPCLLLDDMSEADRRAYMLADNKIALNAGWDPEFLASDLQDLIDREFEMELTGFDPPEIDVILSELSQASPEPDQPADDHPQAQADVATRRGDIWALGRHFLICGDAKDGAVIDGLMQGSKADMGFVDAPYNLKIAGHVSGLGRIRHREFAEASGEMSPTEFTEFLRRTFAVAANACRDGAILFSCIDWRHVGEMIAAGQGIFSELKNICVWAKTNGGMGTFYRSQHEMVLVFKVGTAPHTNTFGLGEKGRYRTNVWSYPGVNTFKSDRMEELASHPTVKPVALVADAIRDVSNRGEIVLDIFGGSGTTLIAAEKTGRCARLVEIDPMYCDVIIRRWEKLTGKNAILTSTGETFEMLQSNRLGSVALQSVDQAA
jgi:DNA modification methylase